jgi:menaquinone-9 beta-reductase
MTRGHYDLMIVGGGLGGAALAKATAEHGMQVLVLERQRRFTDRVRGEFMTPWGVAEARDLGLYEVVRDACGNDVRRTDLGFGPRDVVATTPQRLPSLAFYHPAMQEVVLGAAAHAGAEIRRGATVVAVTPGPGPRVVVLQDGYSEELRARLVVGADGRDSRVRTWGGFPVHHDPAPFRFAGLLFADLSVPMDTSLVFFNPSVGLVTAMAAVGKGRFRVYVAYSAGAQARLSGKAQIPRFIEASMKAGPVAACYTGARPIGPLASFRCGDFWVDHPYRDGVALVGDAAATSDPAFGQGLSLTVRDVRVLRDQLVTSTQWDTAGHTYAAEHDRYFGVTHTVNQWLRHIFMEQSPAAEARRLKALPLIAEDLTRVPDHLFSGPELPADDAVRARFFGEA